MVLLYNRAMEGLYKKGADVLTFDLFAGVGGTKAPFIKFCKAFEKRLRSNVPSHRVIPVNEEQPTKLDVAGFITEWKSGKGKNTLSPLTVELQFLEHHKAQYLDLHRDLMKIDYSPQSEAALQNFKTLVVLEISLFLGGDIEWATPPGANDEQ